ncbi:MAG TPA: glycosyl hydrolase, partial [Segetibacter sp.]|nr:glycosyl hydrolase [Segetibacter sp.]
LSSLDIQPDFTYSKPQQSTKLLYVHRKLSDGDLYWINSRNDTAQIVEATFRITGKTPQIWHPETGITEPASYTIANGLTKVTLPLTPNDAVFVVFQSPATKTTVTLPATEKKEIMTLEGPWTVSFQPNRGAPATATFHKLTSYTESQDPAIRYFSGRATYSKTIHLAPGAINKNAHVWLDLGDVKNLAEITVNGQPLGVVWKNPYRVEVTNALKAGGNKVEIKVINLWVNRLIGDAQPGVTNKITYTAMPFYQANSPLQSSGLLGPVKIESVVRK